MYAVIESGNKQYRVSAGDTVQVERLPVEAGQTVTFERVLLVSRDGKSTTGAPTVAQATVEGEVVENIRGEIGHFAPSRTVMLQVECLHTHDRDNRVLRGGKWPLDLDIRLACSTDRIGTQEAADGQE